MKVLVTGGRDYGDARAVRAMLAGISTPATLIHGACPSGADRLAKLAARELGWGELGYPADWSRGKKAGPERNQRMLDEHPDIAMVIAFPGGRGTADMVKRATAAGFNVVHVA